MYLKLIYPSCTENNLNILASANKPYVTIASAYGSEENKCDEKELRYFYTVATLNDNSNAKKERKYRYPRSLATDMI